MDRGDHPTIASSDASWWFCLCPSKELHHNHSTVSGPHVCSFREILEYNARRAQERTESTDQSYFPPLTCVFHNVCAERFPREESPADRYVWKGSRLALLEKRRQRQRDVPHMPFSDSTTRSPETFDVRGSNFIRLYFFSPSPAHARLTPWFLTRDALDAVSDAVSDPMQVLFPRMAHLGEEQMFEDGGAAGCSLQSEVGKGDNGVMMERLGHYIALNRTDTVGLWWAKWLRRVTTVWNVTTNDAAPNDSGAANTTAVGGGVALLSVVPYHHYAYFGVSGLLSRVFPPLHTAALGGGVLALQPPNFHFHDDSDRVVDTMMSRVSVLDWFDHHDDGGHQVVAVRMPEAFNVRKWPRGRCACFSRSPVIIGGVGGHAAYERRMVRLARAYVLRRHHSVAAAAGERVGDQTVCEQRSRGRVVYMKRICQPPAGDRLPALRGSRCIRNTDALEQYFHHTLAGRFGLHVTIAAFGSETPMSHQVDVTSQADLIIGAHGSGLVHAAWLPHPCGRLFELFASKERHQADSFWYRDLMHLHGFPAENHRVWWPPNRTPTAPPAAEQHNESSTELLVARTASKIGKNDDFDVDIEALHQALMAFLKEDARWKHFFERSHAKHVG